MATPVRIRTHGRWWVALGTLIATLTLVAAASSADPGPSISSDKDDYAPGERVTLTGSGWQSGEHVHLNVNDDDGASWQRDLDVVADADGRITDSFTLPDWFVALYRVTATGETSGTASTTFTDARIVTTATLNGGSSVTVGPSASISAAVTVTTDGSGANARWRSTSWLIATTDPAGVNIGTCVDHANHDAAGGPYLETFNVTAPASAGTYNAYFKAHADDTCGGAGGGASALFKLTNAVTVIVDNAAPIGSVSINGDAAATNSTSVTVNLAATDAIGVTAYRIANGSSCSGASYVSVSSATSFSLNVAHTLPAGDGSKTVCAQYKDAAGNESATYTDSIVLDTTAPTISDAGVQSGTAGTNGWYVSAVTNRFTATDNGSGLNAACQTAFPSGNRDVSTGATEGTGVTVSSGPCTDLAGNTNPGISSASFKIDTSGPSAALSVTAGTLGDNGWYTGDVTVHTSGTDSISSPVTCSADQFQTTETSGQPFSGSCTNDAGLSTNAAGLTIKLDKTGPSAALSVTAGTLGDNGWYTSDVTVHTSGTDSISSPVTCSADQFQTTETSGQLFTGSCTNDAGLSTNAAGLTIKLDKTAPVITDLGPTTSPNVNGWYKTDVVNRFQASDDLSGLNSTCLAAYPPSGGDRIQSKTTSGQGAAVTVDSSSCTDLAGNTAAAKTSAAFKIDQTAPTATATAAPPANANGWNNTDVTVSFSGSDGLSGIDTCSAPVTLSSEGAGQSASGHCTDKAGNDSDTATASGINIDKTAPVITDLGPTTSPNVNGWYKTDVVNQFTASDALSGLNAACEIAFPDPVSGGGQQDKTTSGQGAAVTVDSSSCTDLAGNTAAAKTSAAFKIDQTAPVISDLGPTTSPNVNGWYKTDVVNQFTASDALSGLNAACEIAFPDPVSGGGQQDKTTSGQGAAVTVDSSSCTDLAGNTAAAKTSAAFKIDQTAPTATATAAPPANANGWNNTDVTVSFSGSDGLSGIDTCSAPVTLSSEGAGQSASGHCTDKAGNDSDTATASGINVDKTKPTLAWTGGPANGSSHYFGFVPSAPTCTASDTLSGPDTCVVTGYGTSVGPHTMTATAKDKAGNTHTEQRSYTVLGWTLTGFFQPVDMNGVLNTVKNGSTVPLKFRIFAGSTELTDVANVKSLTYTQTNCDASATQDEIETIATGGTSLRYDGSGGQFIYNWKTPSTPGKCVRVTMATQDGSSLVAFFKLK